MASDSCSTDQLAQNLSKISLYPTEFTIGTHCNVKVTHIESTLRFYIRPVSYNRYMGILEAIGDSVAAEEIYFGDILVYRSPKIGRYIRGSVQEVERADNISYSFFALDYGFTESSIELISIRKPQYAVFVPSLISKCILADLSVEHYKGIPNLCERMQALVGKMSKIIVRNRKDDVLEVDLYKVPNNED